MHDPNHFYLSVIAWHLTEAYDMRHLREMLKIYCLQSNSSFLDGACLLCFLVVCVVLPLFCIYRVATSGNLPQNGFLK